MHGQGLQISLAVACPEDDYETSDFQFVNLCNKVFVGDVNILLVVPVTDKSVESFQTLCVKDSVLKPGQ